MTFTLNEEQEALRETIARSFAELCTSSFIRQVGNSADNHDKMWELVKTLGLFEYFSDKDASFVDFISVAFEAGKTLMPSALIESLYWGPWCAMKNPAYASQLKDLKISIDLLASGKHRVTSGFVHHGDEVAFISDPRSAALVIRHPVGNKSGSISLATMPNTKPHECLDLTRSSSGAAVSKMVDIDGQASSRMLFDFMILVSAELSGVAAKAVSLTQEYVLTRKQFGVPVGSFQAVQQQLSEMFLKSEASLALTQFAAGVSTEDEKQLALAARSSLMYSMLNVPKLVETAIQLHGGIGFTWEYDLHLYLRRARTLASLYALGHDDEQAILNEAVQ